MMASVMASRCPARILSVSQTPGASCRLSQQPLQRFRYQARLSPSALSMLTRYYASKSFPPHTVISMPALSPTMQAGNIGSWQKGPGDNLAPGDVLVEIETDKAQMDFEFQEEGTLAKILKDTGEKDVAVGSPIAVMVEEGEDVSAFENFTLEDAGGEKAPPKEAPKQEASEASEKPDSGSGSAPAKSESSTSAPEAQESDSTGGRLEAAIDRAPVKVVSAKDAAPASPAASPAASAGAPAYEDIPASSMRKTIATRLRDSMNQSPHFYVSTTLSVGKLMKLREALNASADGKYKLSVNDFLIKACALACKKIPQVNSSWREIDGQTVIREHKTVDVSVAVATPIGLMTPIVKNADTIGLSSISGAVKELGKRARDGKLKPDEYQGGTFTISNMGMNNAIERFTAVVNPPQAAILAVGTTRKVAVPVETAEGTITEWEEQIIVTASFDHKVVDGAVGGEWIRELKKIVENPLELML